MSSAHAAGEPGADAIVIGAGAVGVCCAYYLAKSGRSVILIDKGDVCAGCSYGNACLITATHAVPLPAPGVIKQALKWMWKEDSPLLIRARLDPQLLYWLLRFARNCRPEPMLRGIPVVRDLCRTSMALFEDLVREERLEFYYERRGLLYVNSSAAGFAKARRDAELLGRYGFESRVLEGRGVCEMEPAVRETVAGGVFYPEDAHGDSNLFVTDLARRLPPLGVSIQTKTRMSGLKTNGRGGVEVVTDRGSFRARHLVLAGGSWVPELAGPLGIRVPVQPGKGYSVTITKPENAPRIPVVHQERKVTVTPIGDRLRFAGTMEFAGMDLRMNDVRAEAALRGGSEVLKPMGKPQNLERWCGLRPCTPDGIPIIDRAPGHQNVYIACGHAMLGYTMGPITGKLVTEMVTGAPLSLPAEPLRLSRF